jgi:CheY-like chemotaxis protein
VLDFISTRLDITSSPALNQALDDPRRLDGPDHAEPSLQTAPATPEVTICRTLVVDDNADLATTTAMLLSLQGHNAVAAFSGRDAIAKARELSPDLVILDLGLPDIRGQDVARILREEVGLHDATIVAVTAQHPRTDRSLAHIDQVHYKPCNVLELLNILPH